MVAGLQGVLTGILTVLVAGRGCRSSVGRETLDLQNCVGGRVRIRFA